MTYLCIRVRVIVWQAVTTSADEDIAAGKELAFDRAMGNCLACHLLVCHSPCLRPSGGHD